MSKRRLPTEKEATELREMYQKGTPRQKMQQYFAIANNTLMYWHTHLDLEIKKGNPRKYRSDDLTEDEKPDFIAFYAEKPTQDQVLKKYNISVATFEIWIKKLGIKKHPQAVRPGFDETAIMLTDRAESKSNKTDSEPFVSLSQKFRNLNGHNSVKLNPYR
jgi:hypothetical protein